jgi:UDP-N-acetylmuramoyl-tripeptide--D-alanyl-D-alanine ligase
MELGANADALHAEVGRYAKQAGISRLFALGQHSHYAVEAFGAGARWFADIDALIAETRSSLAPGVAVLIKGSRSNRLERVSNALAAEPGRGSDER